MGIKAHLVLRFAAGEHKTNMRIAGAMRKSSLALANNSRLKALRLAGLAALCLTAACSNGERRDPELSRRFIEHVCDYALIDAGYGGTVELPDVEFCSCLAARDELPTYDDILKIALVEHSGGPAGELTPAQLRASIACGDAMEW